MRSESVRIGPDDPRYRAVIDKRFNKRFSANPDYVRLVSSTDQVAAAVEEAVWETRPRVLRVHAWGRGQENAVPDGRRVG